jgi:hypothetical protein
MAQTVFFSWQADTPNRVSRSFLKEVLEEVCKGIASDPTVDEALRDLEVDSDIQGVAGQPPIIETILKKIDASALFVGDMTLVGARKNGSRVPNPNVLIEYGWALKALTHERVIWVMNTAYGEPIGENLPFDLRHAKRPTGYNLPEDATAELKKSEKQKLVKSLSAAIRASLETVPVLAIALPPKFPEAVANDGPARFRRPKESLGLSDDEVNFPDKEFSLSGGPAMWLRLMPEVDTGKHWSALTLKECATNSMRPLLLPLIRQQPGYSYLRADDGYGIFPIEQGDRASRLRVIPIKSVAFVFETGEIWSVDLSLLEKDTGILPFVEDFYTEAIRNYGLFLRALGVEDPYRWKAGIVDVYGRYFNISRYERVGHGPRCATNLIEAEGQYGCEDDAAKALEPFFRLIFEKCGLPYHRK